MKLSVFRVLLLFVTCVEKAFAEKLLWLMVEKGLEIFNFVTIFSVLINNTTNSLFQLPES